MVSGKEIGGRKMNYNDLPEKPTYTVKEYEDLEKCVIESLKQKRKYKDASYAILNKSGSFNYGSSAFANGITAYVRLERKSLAEKVVVLCKLTLRSSKLKKDYEQFISKVAAAEDKKHEITQEKTKEKNTAHQLLRKVVSKYGFRLWDSPFHHEDASASGKILGNEVSVHYDQKANNFSVEMYHIEIDEIEKVLAALKGLEKKS